MTDRQKDELVERDTAIQSAFAAGWYAARYANGEKNVADEFDRWWRVVGTFASCPTCHGRGMEEGEVREEGVESWAVPCPSCGATEPSGREAVDLPGGIEGEVWSVDDVLPVAPSEDGSEGDGWDVCACGHYRGEHGPDGCEVVVIAGGRESDCPCRDFTASMLSPSPAPPAGEEWPGCGDCRICLATVETPGTRMIVCPDCGNKRCPRAEYHGYRCTASNEPHQRPALATEKAPPAGEREPDGWEVRGPGMEPFIRYTRDGAEAEVERFTDATMRPFCYIAPIPQEGEDHD